MIFDNDNIKIAKVLAKNTLSAERFRKRILIFTIAFSLCLLLSITLILLGSSERHKATQADKAQITMAITDLDQLSQLEMQPEVDWVGIYAALGYSYQNNTTLNILFEDAAQLSNQETLSYQGAFPQGPKEVMLPQNYIDYLGGSIHAGDSVELDLTGLGGKENYIVTGIIDITSSTKDYFIWVSEECAIDLMGDQPVPRTAYIRLDTDSVNMDALTGLGMDLAERCGGLAESVQIIPDYYAVMSGSDTGGTYTTIVPVALAVFILAGLVIYSIFYAAVVNKVRSLGQLRTIGMTKKQVKKMVRTESHILLFYSIPLGIVLGIALGYLLDPKGFRIQNAIICAVVFSLLIIVTTLVAVRVPVKVAANISPMEGVRYNPYQSGKAKKKRSQELLTPVKMGFMNLKRFAKKSILISIMLSFSGILLAVVMTLSSSLSPRAMAEFYMFPFGDYQIRIQDVEQSSFDYENIGKDRVSELQYKDNPLGEDLVKVLQGIEGVEAVKSENCVNLAIEYSNASLLSPISGTSGLIPALSRKQCEQISESIVEGTSDYDTLNEMNGILIRKGAIGLHTGENVTLSGHDGSGKAFKLEVPVMGIYDANIQQEILPLSTASDFMVTDALVAELTGIENQTGLLAVSVNAAEKETAEKALVDLTNTNNEIELHTIEDSIRTRQSLFEMEIRPLYLISIILFLFSVISMANTTLTNLLTRKQELALLQAIGMTKGQQKKMIQVEELYYIGLAALSTIILGGAISFSICAYINHIAHCIQFTYPVFTIFAFIIVLSIVEIILTTLAFRTTIKESVIDRLVQYE